MIKTISYELKKAFDMWKYHVCIFPILVLILLLVPIHDELIKKQWMEIVLILITYALIYGCFAFMIIIPYSTMIWELRSSHGSHELFRVEKYHNVLAGNLCVTMLSSSMMLFLIRVGGMAMKRYSTDSISFFTMQSNMGDLFIWCQVGFFGPLLFLTIYYLLGIRYGRRHEFLSFICTSMTLRAFQESMKKEGYLILMMVLCSVIMFLYLIWRVPHINEKFN